MTYEYGKNSRDGKSSQSVRQDTGMSSRPLGPPGIKGPLLKGQLLPVGPCPLAPVKPDGVSRAGQATEKGTSTAPIFPLKSQIKLFPNTAAEAL